MGFYALRDQRSSIRDQRSEMRFVSSSWYQIQMLAHPVSEDRGHWSERLQTGETPKNLEKEVINYSKCGISWVRRIILCMFLQSRPLPPTGAHVRSPAPRIVHGVELHRGPLLEQLDCLACGRDGFIGYLREHSLLPLHSQQPAQRQACIIDELLAATTLSQRSGYPQQTHVDTVHGVAHACKQHLCGQMDQDYEVVSLCLSRRSFCPSSLCCVSKKQNAWTILFQQRSGINVESQYFSSTTAASKDQYIFIFSRIPVERRMRLFSQKR